MKRGGSASPAVLSWPHAAAGATCLLVLVWTNYRVGHLRGVGHLSSEIRHQQQQPDTDAGGSTNYQGAELVMVAATNSAYLDWSLNWSKFCSRLGVPHLVIAFDSEAAAALHMHSITTFDASGDPLVPADNIRVDFVALRQMSFLKIDIALQLMQRHSWGSVLLSDTDIAWLKHPGGLLRDYPLADLMVATDCCSQRAVDERLVDVPRCGVTPGTKVLSSWNSGVVLFRNTPPALAAIRDWQDRLAAGSPEKEDGWWLDDQLTLTMTLDLESVPFESGDLSWDDTGTLLTFKKQVRTMPLPPLVVAGGHVAFEQRLPELLGVTPYALHATFQEFQADVGKRARFDENLLWLLHPLDHYRGRFITYDNLVEAWIDRVSAAWKLHTGHEMVLFHKHFLAGAFQLQVLAEALQAAYVLQRALVPPRFVCYCWKDTSQMVDQLHTCSALGIDKQPPFHCNMDAFIDLEVAQAYPSLLRFPNFLAHEELADMVQHNTVTVRLLDPADTRGAAAHVATRRPEAASGGRRRPQPVLPLYATDKDLLRALRNHEQVGVVYLGGLAPGWLAGGLSDPKAQAAVETAVQQLTNMPSPWCCLTAPIENQTMVHAEVRQQQPAVGTAHAAASQHAVEAGGSVASAMDALLHVMTVGAKEWLPADEWFQRPAWCSEEGFLTPFNRNVSQWRQHPCSYLAPAVVAQLQLPAWKQQMLQALRAVHRLRVAGTAVQSDAAQVPHS